MVATTDAILLENADLQNIPRPSKYFYKDIESIQDSLDSFIKDLSSDWKGSIPFCCHVVDNYDQVHEKLLEDPPSMIDIGDYLGGQMYPATKLLFSPIIYPPPKPNWEMSLLNSETCTGWTALSRDLAVAAHEASTSIICNGSLKLNGTNCNRAFRCGTFHRSTRTSSMELTEDCQFRNTSLINDRRNNRQHGQLLSKRIKVVDQRGCTCRFQFMVKWDINLCFYIDLRQRNGCS